MKQNWKNLVVLPKFIEKPPSKYAVPAVWSYERDFFVFPMGKG